MNTNDNDSSNIISMTASGSVGNIISMSITHQKSCGNIQSMSMTEHSGNVSCTSTVANKSIESNTQNSATKSSKTFVYSNNINIKAVVLSSVLKENMHACNDKVDMIDIALSSKEKIQSIPLGCDYVPSVLTKWMNNTSLSKKCFYAKTKN